MTTLYEHIGHKIRELRTTYPKGTLSQEALAEKLKVASNTVSRWETGKYKPTPKDLDSLAHLAAPIEQVHEWLQSHIQAIEDAAI